MNQRRSSAFGGAGGAYFLATQGEFKVEVHKRDLNLLDVHTELRALLVSPNRSVVCEAFIPDDGLPGGSGTGPVQSVTLSTQVEQPGIFGLNVTVSGDRYGGNVAWGFETNCERYVIETARGHKDEAHTEPIVFIQPGESGIICFQPTSDEFSVEITEFGDVSGTVRVTDASGRVLDESEISSGMVKMSFPERDRNPTPWQIHVPDQCCTVHIDGVTRWPKAIGGIFDKAQSLTLWTPDPESWFPLQDVRWLITPYQQTRFGNQGTVVFQVENGSAIAQVFDVVIEGNSSDGLSIFMEVGEYSSDSASPGQCAVIALGAGESELVHICYSNSDEHTTAKEVRIRVTPREHSELSTYATLFLKPGIAPADQPINMPLVLRPYSHENEQLGHVPDFPTENQLYFDLSNRPYAWVPGGISRLYEGEWQWTDLSVGMASSKIAFDADDNVYALAASEEGFALHCSSDSGETYDSFLFQGADRKASFDIEQFSGHNVPATPPPILRYRKTQSDERLIWRRLNDLELILPEREGTTVSFGDPIPVARGCIGLSSHSGIVSSVISRGSKIHMVWAEATDPDEVLPGVPTYVATYDRDSAKLGEKVFIGYGPPPNDCHNSPSITMDSQGFIHVMVGTHGAPFPYATSLQPNDLYSGWTEAKVVGEELRQTYVGFVCDREDTLHLVFRLWQEGTSHHPHSHCAVLTHMRKRVGEPWSEPIPLIYPPFSEYSVYYHRLTIDRLGRLFLSYDYWSTYWFYRNDHVGRRRTSMMSPDGGESWRMVSTKLLQ